MIDLLTALWYASAVIPVAASPQLPPYSGPKPPWPYRGYSRFPAVWFGQNRSGLDSATEMALEAKHQIVGWGWQQNYNTVGKYKANHTTGTNGTYYQQETSLAQMASRFAAYVEFSPPNYTRQVQATFVYRHMEVAEYYWSIAAAAFHDPRNAEMFLHNEEGQVCWKTNDMTGPFWNFSNARAMDWFVEEIGGELTRESDINAVFFDETDWLYCGPVFNNCSHSTVTADQYHHKIEMMRRLAVKLNAAGIWPIYSTFNGFKGTEYRDCPFPFDEYYETLANVGWFRFYEWGIGNTKPEGGPGSEAQILQALRESELGLPVIVHAYLDKDAKLPLNTPRTLPLALFLLAQTDYWYLGISSGWDDKDWSWWPEYDQHYGKPLGRAAQTIDPPGWKREFEGCTVTVTADLKNASIGFHSRERVQLHV